MDLESTSTSPDFGPPRSRAATVGLLGAVMWSFLAMLPYQAHSQATSSTAFTYQGSLLADDVEVTGHFDFTFQLCDASTAGNPLM